MNPSKAAPSNISPRGGNGNAGPYDRQCERQYQNPEPTDRYNNNNYNDNNYNQPRPNNGRSQTRPDSGNRFDSRYADTNNRDRQHTPPTNNNYNNDHDDYSSPYMTQQQAAQAKVLHAKSLVQQEERGTVNNVRGRRVVGASAAPFANDFSWDNGGN